MIRTYRLLMLYTAGFLLFSCSQPAPKLTAEQAAEFSVQFENQVRDMKIDFLEKNIIIPEFSQKVNTAGQLKASERTATEMKRTLASNNYERNIYNIMGDNGTFKKVKQYEKEGQQHIIYRVNGSGGFTYLDMELMADKKRVGIADIFLYNTGENLSTTLADLLKKFLGHEQSSIAGQLENRLNRINSYLKNTDYEMAKKEFDRLPYNIRTNRLYEMRYLEILSKLGGEEYLRYQQQIETKYADDAGFQLMMIDVYLNQKKYDKALSSINQVDSVINKDPFLDYYRGLVLKMKGDTDGALRYFEQIAAADATLAEVYPELINGYASKKDFARANQYFAMYKEMKKADENIVTYLQNTYPGLD